MAMRRFLLLLILISCGALFAQAPAQQRAPQGQPPIYRWKDSKGKLYITTTPPPPGAKAMGLPPEQNTKERDTPKSSPNAGQVDFEAPPNQVLSETQRGFWQTIARDLGEARAKGDRAAMESMADSIFADSFWGSGLWVLPALPAASLLLFVLLGWLLASGLKGAMRGLTMGCFVLLGVVLADLSLVEFVFRPQLHRLEGNLVLLHLNLGGGKMLSPEHKEELDARLKALEAGTEFTSAPWRFPAEARGLKTALREMVADP